MPFPLLLIPIVLKGAAVIAGAVGVKKGVEGAIKVKDANDTIKSADYAHKENIARFEKNRDKTICSMDMLGKNELEILGSFERFCEIFEKIQGKPQFKTYEKNGVTIPQYNAENLKQVYVGAGVLLGGLAGAAAGAAGGFAAAGAATASVVALGTASTGTAISALKGIAATKATLAALGGGTLTAGGGGIAAATTVLGATTLGVGLLIGGVIFSITGSSLSEKADEAWSQMKKAEKEINKICAYLKQLRSTASEYNKTLSTVNGIYSEHINKLSDIVDTRNVTEWSLFSDEEKLITENTVLLVNLLYNMCKVQIVLASESETELNRVNTEAIEKSKSDAHVFLGERGLAM